MLLIVAIVVFAFPMVLVILRVAEMPGRKSSVIPAPATGKAESTQAIDEPLADEPVVLRRAVWLEGFSRVGDVRSADAPFDTFFYCNGPAANRFLHVTPQLLYEDDQRRFASPDLHPTMLRLRDALDQAVEIWASHGFGTCRPNLRCDVELRDLPWSRARLTMVEQADGYALAGIRLYGELDVLLSPLREEHGEANEVCRIAPLDDEQFEKLFEAQGWGDYPGRSGALQR